MAASAVCDQKKKHKWQRENMLGNYHSPQLQDTKLLNGIMVITDLRQWLEDKTNGHHYQKYHDRWQQTGNLRSECSKKRRSNLIDPRKERLGRCVKQILSFGTCVFPPVLSCTRLLDIEQVMAKVWKKELMKLQRPRARSSWNTNMQITTQWDGKYSGLSPKQVILQKAGTTKAKKGLFFTTYCQKYLSTLMYLLFSHLVMYLKTVKVKTKSWGKKQKINK